MTEVAAPEDSSSSSSSSSAPLRGFSTTTTISQSSASSSPQSASASSSSNYQQHRNTNSASTTNNNSKPRRFLSQKLDIPPRQFDQVNQVSVVKMSDQLATTSSPSLISNDQQQQQRPTSTTTSKLCISTLMTNNNNSNKQVSPNSCLSISSSATTSPSLASAAPSIRQRQSSSSSFKCSPFNSSTTSSSQMQDCGGRTLSNVSSIPSSLPSPQVTQVAQFGGTQDPVQAQEDADHQTDEVEEDSSSPSSEQKKQQQQQQCHHHQEDDVAVVSESSSGSYSSQFTASLVHPNIYLGAAIDANDAATLIAHGIFYVLNVAYECAFSDSVMNCDQIHKKKINLRDTVQENIEPSFEDAFSFIDAAIEQNKKILVHCFMGASRSATIVIAYIMRKLADKDLAEQVFAATRSSIISKHQQDDRAETCQSPTVIDSLMRITTTSRKEDNDSSSSSCQQQQQQKAFPPISTTTTSRNSSSSSSGFVVASSSSTSSSTTTPTTSYYSTALDQVQRARPDILPNLAFCHALLKMDDKLMLRSTETCF